MDNCPKCIEKERIIRELLTQMEKYLTFIMKVSQKDIDKAIDNECKSCVEKEKEIKELVKELAKYAPSAPVTREDFEWAMEQLAIAGIEPSKTPVEDQEWQ